MEILDFLLSLLVALASLYLALLAYRETRKLFRFVAILLCAIGFFLAAASLLQTTTPLTSNSKTVVLRKGEKSSPGQQVLLLNAGGTNPERRINLEKQKLSEEFTRLTEGQEAFYLLDASAGILPENVPLLQDIFGDLKLEEAKAQEASDICWLRQPLFTLATGVCESRLVRWYIYAGPDDLTRTKNNFSTARVALKNSVRWVLITHSIPDKNLSIEEQCLVGLSRGAACAAVEILPAASTAAINITSTDPTIQSVLEEFSVSVPKDLNDSLSIYSNIETPLIEKLPDLAEEEDSYPCGGIVLSPEPRLKVLHLEGISEELKLADTESKLSKAAKNLTRYLSCPGLSYLNVPKLKKKDLKISARSFMTHAMKHSFWFTDAKSYLNRLTKVQSVLLQTDESQQNLLLENTNGLRSLSIAFVMPNRFPEEMLQAITVVNPGSDWSLYRMGSYSFRLSVDKPSEGAFVELSPFFGSLQVNQLGFKNFLRSVGILPALQLAFVIATILAFVHVTASRRPVLWILTFLPVSIITFILVFLSIISARLPSGNNTSLAQMENPPTPTHLFLRDWPDQWFEKPRELEAQMILASRIQSEKWIKALKTAEQAASSADSADRIEYLSQKVIYKKEKPGTRNIVLWDHPNARNFFFRKSSVYQSLILGWREISSAQTSILISAASNYEQLANSLNRQSVLIIPDIGFLSESDLAAVDEFAKSGGVIVFSEELDANAGSNKIKIQGPFAEALQAAGLGRSTASNYSKVNFEGIPVSEIDTSHRFLKKESRLVNGISWGSGAVVFVGVQPLSGPSRRFLIEVISRLQGETKRIVNLGDGCSTALFVQPWAASMSELDSFSRSIKQAGYDLKWMVDPISLAKMAPLWENRLRSDGVVFLDDGKVNTRVLATEILKTLQGPTARPVFVSLEEKENKNFPGPLGEMITARAINAMETSYQAELWRSECSLSVAHPRVILSAGKGTDWAEVAKNLRLRGPQNLTGLSSYMQKLKELKNASEETETRKIEFKLENPLEMYRSKNE